MGQIVTGIITEITEAGGLIISAPCPDLDKLLAQRSDRVLIEIVDGRKRSPEQLRKYWAIIGEIADWSGHLPAYVHKHMKFDFMTDKYRSLADWLSMADTDMTTAREIISFLIEFVLEFDVPTRVPLYELCDDLERYIYATLVNKKCAVCGRRGELHHDPPLGMGMDRAEAPQLGMTAICLCREHHNQAHAHGMAFLDELHLIPVPIDDKIAKAHKMTRKARRAT